MPQNTQAPPPRLSAPRIANGCLRPVWMGLVGHQPCRTCVVCNENENWKWTQRADLETKAHAKTYFATLTMRPRSATWQPTRDNMLKDLQDYLKRLRKKGTFRYLCAPEYGDKNGRFHWHLLIHTDAPAINTKSIRRHWKQGITHCRLTDKKSRYVCKYLTKQDGRKQASLKYGEAIKEHLEANSLVSEIFKTFDKARIKRVGQTPVPHKSAKRLNAELHDANPKHQFTDRKRIDSMERDRPY